MTKEKYISLCNQPVYKIAFARLREDFAGHKAGSEYPIYFDNLIVEPRNVAIMIRGSHAIDIINVPKECVKLFKKQFTPKYKLGDIVFKKTAKDELGAFRVWEYYWDRVQIAYRDGWGIGTNLASQVYESELRLATKEECNSWCIEYNDNIVKEKKPDLYNSIIK